MCMSFDTVSVIKESIKHLITRGENFEDPELLQYTMRTNKLTGCLGSVFFDQFDNSRAYTNFIVQQIRRNNTSQDLYLHDTIIIDIYSSNIMTILDTFVWPDESSLPSNFRPHNPCPFDNYQIIDSSKGRFVLYLLSLGFLILSVLSVWFSYKKVKLNTKEIKEKQIMTASDMFFLSYFVFQCLQLITEGPDQLALDSKIKSYQYLFSLDVDRYFYFTFGSF